MKRRRRSARAKPIPKPSLKVELMDVSKLVLETHELVTPELNSLGIQSSLVVERFAYGAVDETAIQHVLLGTFDLGGKYGFIWEAGFPPSCAR